MLVAVPIDPRAQGSLVDTQLAGDFGGRSLGLDHHLHRLFTVFRSELTIFRHNDPSSSGDILPYWVTVRWEPHTPHKTAARGFDGYRGHIAIDPDAEIITATTVTAGNTGDAVAAGALLAGDVPDPGSDAEQTGADQDVQAGAAHAPLTVYGDAAYGAGALLVDLEAAGAQIMTKVQPPVAPGGRFAKDRFVIDTDAGTVTCPAHVIVAIRPAKAGGGTAAFATACGSCPLAAQCTTAAAGRNIKIGRYEAELTRARTTQQDPAWRADYRATRPKVERKLGHLMRRRHGGRRARVRGQAKVAADFSLLAAAVNLARFGVLGLTQAPVPRWAVAPS